MPQASFGGEFLHGSLFEMAAAYLFHLVQNHPFIDGNKRIGVASAIVFLEMNDFTLDVNQDELAEFVLSVARGEIDKNQIRIFLEQHVHPKPPSVGD
jgi:death-on-curing protein